MATLYFNNAEDDQEWSTLGNWWLNAACTTPATSLPTSSDSVEQGDGYGGGTVYNSGSEPTVVNVNMPNTELYFSITVTGLAIIYRLGSLASPYSTLTGDAVLADIFGGIVTGDATISGALNLGSVGGTATFTGVTVGDGLIDGTVGSGVFYNNTQCVANQTVTNNATFNDSSVCNGTVGGDATFNDDAIGESGTIDGDGTFNDRTFNINMSVGGEVKMYDYSNAQYDGESVIGGITFYDNSTCSSPFLDFGVNVVGSPIVLTEPLGGGQLWFIRRSGINGSSILGVA